MSQSSTGQIIDHRRSPCLAAQDHQAQRQSGLHRAAIGSRDRGLDCVLQGAGTCEGSDMNFSKQTELVKEWATAEGLIAEPFVHECSENAAGWPQD
jgi:hypothetical protein